jgi:beta-mannosidase
MGTLYWQHNDCWPVASWSSRDYYGRWKAQHYFAKKAFEPILVSPIAKDDKLEVYIVSDQLKTVKGILYIKVMDLKGNLVYEKNKKVTLPPNSSNVQFTELLTTLLNGKNRNEVVVNARFIEYNKKLSITSNNYFLARYKEIDFPQAKITVSSVPSTAGEGYDVTVKSDVFARGVFLSIEGIDNFFSDNYFDLLPGEPRTIHVDTNLDKATFDKQLKSESISSAY